jgi:hypothetical protein
MPTSLDPAGLTFFAEDAFGDQFAYSGTAAEVVIFEAELGRVVPFAASFTAWLEEMIERPGGVLPLDVLAARAGTAELAHRPGTQLYAWPPLFSPEAQGGVTLGRVDAIEAMRCRGQLAERFRGQRPGTRIEIDFTGERR